MDSFASSRSRRKLAQAVSSVERRRRPRLRVRIRTALRAAELDESLAGGADPLASDELTLRATQLVASGKRLELARALEMIIAQVEMGGCSPPGPTILRRDPISRNGSGLRALVRRLASDDLQCLPGLAMADRLIRYGDTPLYMALDSLQLRYRIEEVTAALEPDWDGQPADRAELDR